MSENKISIDKFYENRCVLITGVTGFIGKVLLEKLLRSCESIGTIYVLLRPKKFIEPRKRLEELLTAEVFERIKCDNPEVISKLVPISGDIDLPGLSIMKSDLKILSENVSVVFHLAATVKFCEPLKVALNTNLLGTKRIINLCREMKQLKAFVHVSTAFCNCDQKYIEEVIYSSPTPVDKIIKLNELLDDEYFDLLTPRLIGKKPNTYTYTKALTESFLAEECADLPLAIVRPSIVAATWKEPIPGWVDSINGATGLYAAAGKGFLRTLHCNKSAAAEVIPVDVVVNLLIAVGWYIHEHRSDEIIVYNCVSSSVNKVTWGESDDLVSKAILHNPSADLFRYPYTNILTESKMWNSLRNIFNHKLYAYTVDTILFLTGRKRKLVRMYEKLYANLKPLSYFVRVEWKYEYKNAMTLYSIMDPTDQKKYNFDIRSLNWEMYIGDYFLGIRKFIYKEDPSSIPLARMKLRRWRLYSYALQVLVVCLIIAKYVSYKKLAMWLLMNAGKSYGFVFSKLNKQPFK